MTHHSEVVFEFIEEVLNKGNIEETGKYFHDDVVEQAPLPGQGPGLGGLKEVLRGLITAFHGMHWSVEEQVEEGDKVVTRFVWSGKHQSEFFGIPATGRHVAVWGIVIDHFVGAKIKETRIIMDGLGLMVQLGVFPPQVSD
ncbi:ester cyclase [Halomonas sp. TRM85114]|uniref:ester cyclase n=1 Tax=Halomonas jincaotanensis TaxID=2810616 RepID=UPI001BD31B78|nr:ester cyclase [Halomonas jincaotanensis]MBS9405672.1 ester cyclase [Halomonas jincaotanensis]